MAGEQLIGFIPLAKLDVARREVWGWAAEEAPDRGREIMDYAASKPRFLAWSEAMSKASNGKSLGNVRSMHAKIATGKVIHLEAMDELKKLWVGVKVVDDEEWRKVEEGVYTGFSVGGDYGKRWADPGRPGYTRYEALPVELSLVDVPCMPGAQFEVIKADGSRELRKFALTPAMSTSHPSPKGREEQTGAMAAFYLTTLAQELPDYRAMLPEGARAIEPGEMHLTLAYLGETGELRYSREEVVAAVREFARAAQPISGEVAGVGRFMTAEDGMNPFYASFDSPELPAFRQALAAFLKERGIEPVQNHGFTPHITLAYIPLEAPMPDLRFEPIPMTFYAVYVAWGDEDLAVETLEGAANLGKGLSLDGLGNLVRGAWRSKFDPAEEKEVREDASWVREVFEDYVIVERGGKLFRYTYTLDETGVVNFGNEAEEVETQYVPLSPLAPDQQAANVPAVAGEGEEISLGGGVDVSKLNLNKAAADHQKALAMLQGLRDEVETGGDLESATLYSQAIALLLQASGEGEDGLTPAVEPAQPSPEEGQGEAEGEPVAGGAEAVNEALEMAAKAGALTLKGKGGLRKTGRTFSGQNTQAMHGVIQALANILAGSGDEVAQKVAACYAPETPPTNEGDLGKAAQGGRVGYNDAPVQEALGKLLARVEQLERQPAPGGPVLRPVEKVLPGGQLGEGSQQPRAPQPGKSVEELRRLAAVEPNPMVRAEYTRQLVVAEQATVKK